MLKDKINKWKRHTGLNVNQLAKLTGVSAPSIYRFVRGKRDLIYKNAMKIERFIDKSMGE